MENGTQNFAQAGEGDASQIYPKSPASAVVPRAFDAAIRHLTPSGRHAEICALFDRRVSYSSIKFWRYGKRPAPQWARDMLRAHLAKQRAAIETLDLRLVYMPIAPGQGANAIKAARKAALIAEKKKAGG